VRAVPAGGRIAFVTYYFRDRELARELAVAAQRGVDVRVLLEWRTRRRGANRAVVEILRAALGEKLRVVDRPLALRVHAKLYAFSGPGAPCALIGSFNPSGDRVELEPEAIAEIGDQDRGFNALVALEDEALVAWSFALAERLHASAFARVGSVPLLRPRHFERTGDALWTLPRLGASPLLRRLRALGEGARVRVAATHLSGKLALEALAALAARGARVEVVAEGTERRVPRALEARLRDAGVAVVRAQREPHLPMHAKFTLIECGAAREVWFGSANWSDRSLLRNFELLARSEDAALFDAFARLWDRVERYANEARA
jgi:phosphatidylserine/phosphatidylglycerophosphate/cardiolipin synthase-like enzyme